jgi:hypothetical protein
MKKQNGTHLTIEQFRRTQKAQPFVPFTIRLADGRFYDIEHPDFVSSHPQGRIIIVYDENGNFEMIDLLLVVGLEVHQSHGTGRKKKSA